MIPIYRAKSNERKNIYVEGLLIGVDEELLNNEIKPEEILAISFNEAMTILEEAFLENKSLVKTLEKMNEEMIDLRKENQDLKESNNELLEGLISTQKRLEEWLEKCK